MATLSLEGLERFLGELGLATPIPQFEPANVLSKPSDIGRSVLADVLHQSLQKHDRTTVYNAIKSSTNDILPEDYTVVLKVFEHEDDDADGLGVALMREFPGIRLFVLPILEGPIMRFIYSDLLPKFVVPYIKDRGPDYGKILCHGLRDPAASPDSSAKRKKVVVEFSSPNIIEDFKAKHLRSTLLGKFVANLYEHMGWDVVRLNYFGDWGNNIGLFCVGWPKFGCEEKMDDYRHLAEVYSQANERLEAERPSKKDKKKAQANGQSNGQNGNVSPEIKPKGLEVEREECSKKLEERDPDAIKLWNKARQVSLSHYGPALYGDRLGITFDEHLCESGVDPDTIKEVEEVLRELGLCEDKEDGTVFIDLTKFDQPAVANLRKGGITTYFLRDLGTAVERYRKHDFDKMVYVVPHEQQSHFSKVKKTLELMDAKFPGLGAKFQPLYFSGVMGKGAADLQPLGRHLDDMLDQAQAAMQDSLAAEPDKAAVLVGQSADDGGAAAAATAKVGINALVAHEMQAKRLHPHSAIDWASITSIEPAQTGPYMQYMHACTKRQMLAGSGGDGAADNGLDGLDMSSLTLQGGASSPDPFTELLRVLVLYPDVTAVAYDTMEPSPIMTCLQNVTTQLAFCLAEVDDGVELTPSRKAVLDAGRQVLENGMALLGMVA